jgi:hypothetical protein
METLGGVAALAVVLGVPLGIILLTQRRRPIEDVVTTGSARGQTGLAIHPHRGHPFVNVIAVVIVLGVLALGAWYLDSSPYAAGFCFIGGGLMAYLGWARATGRAGDGTLTFTPQGLHQFYGGSEVFVPWDDVKGLVTTPTELIVETTRPVIPVHHMLPLFGRRGVVTDEAIGLPHRQLPPLPFQEMVELYSTSPAARDELATDAPVQRARELLAHPPVG